MTQAPQYPRSRPVGRLIRIRWPWIAWITLIVLSATALFSLLMTPQYESAAQVLVLTEVKPNLTPQEPSMGTERDLVLSDVVTAVASERTGISQGDLVKAASVSVPPDTQTLSIACSAPDPATATRCAQELAESYVAYKDSQPITTIPERARVVTDALPPLAPSRPAVALNLVAALIVGLALGLLAAMVRDRLDDRVRGSADLERRGLRVLGVVPPDGATDTVAYSALGARVRVALSRFGAGDPAGPGRAPVLVVSPPEEATGTVARDLAEAMASTGDRVVFVDADTSAPVERGGAVAGLLDTLSGRVDPVAALTERKGSRVRHLSLGRPAPGVVGIAPRRWAESATALSAECDEVVAAAPPLDTADGIGIAQSATAVLFVVHDGESTRAAVDRVLEEAGELGIPVVGCVLVAPRPVSWPTWIRKPISATISASSTASGTKPSATAGAVGLPPIPPSPPVSTSNGEVARSRR